MARIDQATVKAIELKAPRASTLDAKSLCSQIKGGEIFSAFSEHERDEIWSRLQEVDGLIPSLFTFFKDLLYLQVCVDCVRRLTTVSSGQSVCEAMERRFTGTGQTVGQVKIQVAEDTIVPREGSRDDQIDLGYRQIIACAMRNYPGMPREPVKEDLIKQSTAKADEAVLRMIADLATELGFESPQITALKQHAGSKNTQENFPHSRPLLVTTGPGVSRNQRYGKPRSRAFEEDHAFLFIDYLHDERQEQSEGITSFFVRQSVYFAFFGRPAKTSTASSRNPRRSPDSSSDTGRMEDDIDHILSSYGDGQDSRREERDRQEREEQERQERERQERERQEREMQEWETLEQRRRERERQMREREEEERREQERQELEREEEGRRERERQERERERQERERERQERETREQEKILIYYKIWERGIWRDLPPLAVHPTDSSEVGRVAKKYMRKKIRPLNTRLRMLAPNECFQAVIDDRTHTVLLVAQNSLLIDDSLLQSALRIHDEAMKRVMGLKRVATSDISQLYRVQKRQAI